MAPALNKCYLFGSACSFSCYQKVGPRRDGLALPVGAPTALVGEAVAASEGGAAMAIGDQPEGEHNEDEGVVELTLLEQVLKFSEKIHNINYPHHLRDRAWGEAFSNGMLAIETEREIEQETTHLAAVGQGHRRHVKCFEDCHGDVEAALGEG